MLIPNSWRTQQFQHHNDHHSLKNIAVYSLCQSLKNTTTQTLRYLLQPVKQFLKTAAMNNSQSVMSTYSVSCSKNKYRSWEASHKSDKQ